MKIALWQTAGHPRDVEANLAALDRAARQACAGGASLLLAPECWLSGYNIGPDLARLAQSADGPAAARVAAIARTQGIAITYGYAELDPGTGAIFNSAQVIGPAGERLSHYRKTHLFEAAERASFRAGSGFAAPFAYAGLRFGLLICYDVEFPETVRSLALQGAQAVLVPTALTPEGANVPRHLVPARSIENGIHMAYCNHCGSEDGMQFLGQSCVTGPDGGTLAAAGTAEELLIADIGPGLRDKAPDYLADRRAGLYGALGPCKT